MKKKTVFRKLGYNKADEKQYQDEIMRIVKRMIKKTENEIRKLFKTEAAHQYYAMDANFASQSRILLNKLFREFDELFNKNAKTLAEKQVKRSGKASAAALRGSLTKAFSLDPNLLTPELRIALKSAVNENVALIKSIEQQYISKVQRSVLYSITQGQGLSTVVKHLNKYKGITQRHVKNMARDQVRKTFNLYNSQRLEALGVKNFKWLHSGGGLEPRKDHIAMNGKIYSFDDPPVIDKNTGERGIPGQAYNCRCTMAPVFEFEFELEK